jgi:hypothetical protein
VLTPRTLTVSFMNEPTKLELIDEQGYVAFIATLTERSDHYVTFDIVEIGVWNMDNSPVLDRAEPYAQITIKWDGCSHVYFGGIKDISDPRVPQPSERDAYLHICGPEHWKLHIRMMEWIYKEAEKLIGDKMADFAKWEKTETIER